MSRPRLHLRRRLIEVVALAMIAAGLCGAVATVGIWIAETLRKLAEAAP